MQPQELLSFLETAGKLKQNLRHSWTQNGRQESVAEHSWRLCLAALLTADEVPGIDRGRLLELCLVHDLGEAVLGDIPAFEKTDSDENAERNAVAALCGTLPEPQRSELSALFDEIAARQTPESRLMNALDKLEAVITHNEAPISTWLPLEYDLNPVYGREACAEFAFTAALRENEHRRSLEKIAQAGAKPRKEL